MIATLYSNGTDRLDDGVVHVWRFSCVQTTGEHTRVLSDEERLVASRFVAPVHRKAYEVQHALLRLVLARYLDRAPEQIAFIRGAQGKPLLAGGAKLEFNLSHACDVGLIAIGVVAVGVDIERLDAAIEPRDLSRMVLAPDEQARDRAAFLRIWCRKEAALKACGLGLVDDLTTISVCADRVVLDGMTVHLHDLAISDEHAAALATSAEVGPLAREPIATFDFKRA